MPQVFGNAIAQNLTNLTSRQTTIQEDTPENQRGRVFGLQNNLINIALSLPLVLAGTVVSRYGLLPVLWGLAAIAAIAGLSERPWRSS